MERERIKLFIGGIAVVNKERMLTEFFELVQIKCSTRAEREVADVLKAKLAKLGLEVVEDYAGEKIGGNCGNVLALKKGTVSNAPVIMLSAHMDCVEPCGEIQPKLENGIICSAGDTILGGDDKAGITGILEALRLINENNIAHGDIQVVFTVAEEGGLNGAKNIDTALLKADFGYALDSGGAPGEVIIMAPGQDSVKVKVIGKKAHAGLAPEEGVNAIVVAGKAMAEMNQGRIDFETTANVGTISGGTATNIVPDVVEVKCEARSRNMQKLQQQSRHMKETFERVATENGAKTEIVVKREYNSFVLAEDSQVVQAAARAIEKLKFTADIKGTGGGSDANLFNSYGIPTAILGVGMSKVHTTEEFIKEVDLYNTGELVLAIIKEVAQMKK
jgi:tripeptide aminopeptidase